MEITFEDFTKVELKVGTILAVSKIEKSDKLLKLIVDLGDTIETPQEPTELEGQLSTKRYRTILAGIAKSFTADEIIGKQFLFVTNIPPRKMMGDVSEGMILAVGNDATKLSLMSPTGNVNPGSQAK